MLESVSDFVDLIFAPIRSSKYTISKVRMNRREYSELLRLDFDENKMDTMASSEVIKMGVMAHLCGVTIHIDASLPDNYYRVENEDGWKKWVCGICRTFQDQIECKNDLCVVKHVLGT